MGKGGARTMLWRLVRAVAIAAVLAGGRAALAQGEGTPPPTPAGIPRYPDRPSHILTPPPPPTPWMPASELGMAMYAGGGVTDFTSGATRAETKPGGAWTARLVVGTRRVVGFDGSYVGGANSLSGLGSGSATLIRNGLEGALRVNAPLRVLDTLLEPYALAGVGWNSYHLSNTQGNGSIGLAHDNTLTVPLAVGFTVGYRGFMADVRGTVRPTYNQSLLTQQSGSALSNWDLGAMLGYEF
jgi:hypothetical protein